MNGEFIAIVEKLIAEQGKDALLARGKSFLADYTGTDYQKERRLFTQALEAGVAKAIDSAGDLELCKQQQIQRLHEDCFLDLQIAVDVIDALALVLRGDTGETKAPGEKAAPQAVPPSPPPAPPSPPPVPPAPPFAPKAPANIYPPAKHKFTAKEKIEKGFICIFCVIVGGAVGGILIGIIGGIVGGIAGIISGGLSVLGSGIINGGIFGGIFGIAAGILGGIVGYILRVIFDGRFNIFGEIISIGIIVCISIIGGVVGGIVGSYFSVGIGGGIVIGVFAGTDGWLTAGTISSFS